MACSCGSHNNNGSGSVSLGVLPGGGNVMISSGDIAVNPNNAGSDVGKLNVNGLPSGEAVTFILENTQANPSLVFEAKNSSASKPIKEVYNVSRCTVTAQSPNCTIKLDASSGAIDGKYSSKLAYIIEPGSVTGELKPVQYTFSGGQQPISSGTWGDKCVVIE